MPNPLNNAGIFLINTLFDLYLFVLAIRFILCWARINYFHPVTQFIIKLTQPIVAPIRRMVPTSKGIEYATLIIIFIVEILKFFLIGLFIVGLPNILGVVILALADMLKLFLNLFTYAILLQVILSWIPQTAHSPFTHLLTQITSPILRPIQRMIPPIGGFDLSPIFALIFLQLINILIVAPISIYGLGMIY